jgi:hypothetical protein
MVRGRCDHLYLQAAPFLAETQFSTVALRALRWKISRRTAGFKETSPVTLRVEHYDSRLSRSSRRGEERIPVGPTHKQA